MKLGNVAGGKKLSCCDEIRNFRLLQLRGPFSSSGAWLGFTPPPSRRPWPWRKQKWRKFKYFVNKSSAKQRAGKCEGYASVLAFYTHIYTFNTLIYTFFTLIYTFYTLIYTFYTLIYAFFGPPKQIEVNLKAGHLFIWWACFLYLSILPV